MAHSIGERLWICITSCQGYRTLAGVLPDAVNLGHRLQCCPPCSSTAVVLFPLLCLLFLDASHQGQPTPKKRVIKLHLLHLWICGHKWKPPQSLINLQREGDILRLCYSPVSNFGIHRWIQPTAIIPPCFNGDFLFPHAFCFISWNLMYLLFTVLLKWFHLWPLEALAGWLFCSLDMAHIIYLDVSPSDGFAVLLFLALPYFLAPQNAPGSSFVFSAQN